MDPNDTISAVRPAPRTAAAVAPRRTRERLAAWLLWLAAACLLLVAIVHAAGYLTASIAVANSGLEPWLRKAFRALWLGFSLQAALVALVLGIAGWRPRAISPPVLAICGLMPVLSGVLLFWFLESVFGVALSLLAALGLLAGTALAPRAVASPPR